MAKQPHSVALTARYGSAGSLSVPLYYLILYALAEKLGIWHMSAAVVASIVAMPLNFVAHKYWSFRNKSSQGIYRQVGAFAAMQIGMSITNLLMLYFLTDFFGLWWTQLTSTALTTVSKYYIMREIFSTPDAS